LNGLRAIGPLSGAAKVQADVDRETILSQFPGEEEKYLMHTFVAMAVIDCVNA
jgi:hypothetical protein